MIGGALLTFAMFGGCKVAGDDCAPGDIYCSPLSATLLYVETVNPIITTSTLPGRTFSLKPPATAGNFGYEVVLGSGWITSKGIFTAPASLGSTIVRAVGSDGSIETIDVRTDRATGDGTFANEIPTAACANLTEITVTDMNNDGLDDVFASCQGNGIQVWLSNGDGTLTNSATVATADARQIATGDFNGDGSMDGAVSFNGSNSPGLGVYLGNGDGTLQSILGFTTSTTLKTSGFLARADFNRDGIHDLVLRNSGDIDQYRGTGDASGLNAFNLGAYAVNNGRAAAPEDFNGDGFPDLAVVTSFSESEVHLNDGAGSMTPATSVDCGGGGFTEDVTAGDYNNDGFMDYACIQSAGPRAKVILGTGDGTFNGQPDITLAGGTEGMTTADFNGDGNLDFAVDDQTGDQIGVYLGNGDGSMRAVVNYSPGAIPNSGDVRLGDFNADGKADLAVKGNDTIHILLGN